MSRPSNLSLEGRISNFHVENHRQMISKCWPDFRFERKNIWNRFPILSAYIFESPSQNELEKRRCPFKNWAGLPCTHTCFDKNQNLWMTDDDIELHLVCEEKYRKRHTTICVQMVIAHFLFIFFRLLRWFCVCVLFICSKSEADTRNELMNEWTQN